MCLLVILLLFFSSPQLQRLGLKRWSEPRVSVLSWIFQDMVQNHLLFHSVIWGWTRSASADDHDISQVVDVPVRSTCSARRTAFSLWPSITLLSIPPLAPLEKWGRCPFRRSASEECGMHQTRHTRKHTPPKGRIVRPMCWCTEQHFWRICARTVGGELQSGTLKHVHGSNHVMMDSREPLINYHWVIFCYRLTHFTLDYWYL